MIVQIPPRTNAFSEEEARWAETSSKALQSLIRRHAFNGEQIVAERATLHVLVEEPNGDQADLFLPSAALPLIVSVLTELGKGKNVAVVATDREVTTQQAAEYLNVSRPYVVKLLREGRIPYRTVGPRRRVRVQDLLSYKSREEAERHRGLNELVAEAQRLGIY